MANPLIFKKPNDSGRFSEPEKSKGILDDYAVRKDIQTKTIKVASLLFEDGTSMATAAVGGGGDIDDLNDVDTTTSAPSKDHVLKWNGTNWVPAVYNASFTFSINTFTCTSGGNSTVFEAGVNGNTWKAIGAMSFSASYNNGPATGGYVSHTGWSNLTMGGAGYVGPTTNATAVTYPAVAGFKQFTLNATDGVSPTTSTITYYFYNYRFWGISTVSIGWTEAQIEGLASNELSNNKGKSFTVTAGVNDYIMYAYPKRLGTVTFTVGGFEGGFEAPATLSITNPSGCVEDYYVYRSTNKNLGTVTVVAT
jgi:hypothetical protein